MGSPRGYRIALFLMLAILIAGLASACSSSGDDDDDGDDSAAKSERSSSDMDDAIDGGESDEEEGMEAEEPAADGDMGSYDDGDIAFQPSSEISERMVIRSARISLAVENVDEAASWVRSLANRYDGFVFSSETYIRDGSEFAELAIRVPEGQFDSAIVELTEHDLVVEVVSEQSSSDDVSEEYVDNEARLEALEETEDRYLALLSEADDINEILRIESELTDIRSQIESIQGRQNYLDEMTSMSTIMVSLHLPGEEVDDDPEPFVTRIFTDAWSAGEQIIGGILTAAIVIAMIAAVTAPIGFVFYVIARYVMRRMRDTEVAG
ncbi:MAG: DUF4349 domain-containing protein [Chloroflexota bacterium]